MCRFWWARGGYGREADDWDHLADAGLIERARLRKLTFHAELNASLARPTGLKGFDFERADERAALGHLLYLIVERNRPTTKLYDYYSADSRRIHCSALDYARSLPR